MDDDLPPIDIYDHDNVVPLRVAKKKSIRLFSMSELENYPAPRDYLGDAFLSPGGRVMIAGPPKMGKSHLATELLMTAACGGEWMGMRFNKPHRVLYLNAEIREAYLYKRYQKVLSTFSEGERRLIAKNFLVSGRGDVDLGTQAEQIRALVEEHRPSFICFDPMSQFVGGINESDNSDVRDAFTRIINPLTEPDYIPGLEMSVVIVHHTRKGQGQNTFESIRGAGYLYGWLDSGLMLSAKGDNAMISFELRNGEGMYPKLVSLNSDTLRFEEIEVDENDKGLDSFIEKMLLGMGSGWHSGNDMAAIMEATPGYAVSRFGTLSNAWSDHIQKELTARSRDYGVVIEGLRKGKRYRKEA